MLLEAAWKAFDSNFVPVASKLRAGETFKNFKPEFRIRLNRKSGFFLQQNM